MVSYYNSIPYSQKHSAANLAYSAGQHWQWPTNYPTPPNHQFMSEVDAAHSHHQMYYNAHHMFHAPASAPTEWHSPTSSAENFPQNSGSVHQQMLHQHSMHISGAGTVGGGSSSSGSSTGSTGGPNAGNTQLNETVNSIADPHIAEGLPSPPITVSGSEISSPAAPNSSSSPHHVGHHMSNNNNSPSATNNNTIAHNNNNSSNKRSSPVKPQYYDWMKKPSYPAQPTPGKTRTKDKYRVVYTDFQRLELEKEYCTSRYITIRRKTELAQTLSLSERQVKIWFQNRRAKERKQNKKSNDVTALGGVQHPDYSNLVHAKPKLEPEFEHPLAVMGVPRMSLHQHWHSHHPLAAVSAHSHQLHHQSTNAAQIAAAAAAGIGSLSM